MQRQNYDDTYDKHIMTPPTSRSADTEKDQVINELRMKLEKNNEIIFSKNDQIRQMEEDGNRKMSLY